MDVEHMQIGEVAERTSLSLRTIRYYEEVGLVAPSARSQGGFRLYTDSDVDRLLMVKRMKPLDFTIDEMRDMLASLDALAAGPAAHASPALTDRLSMYREIAEQRIEALRVQLDSAESFVAELRQREQITRAPAARRRR